MDDRPTSSRGVCSRSQRRAAATLSSFPSCLDLAADAHASIAAIAKQLAGRPIDKVQSGASRTFEGLVLAIRLWWAVILPPGLNIHAGTRTSVDEMNHDGEQGADRSLIV